VLVIVVVVVVSFTASADAADVTSEKVSKKHIVLIYSRLQQVVIGSVVLAMAVGLTGFDRTGATRAGPGEMGRYGADV
jgi:hypothetical protein